MMKIANKADISGVMKPVVKDTQRKDGTNFILNLLRFFMLLTAMSVKIALGMFPQLLPGWTGIAVCGVLYTITLIFVCIRKANEWERAIVLRFGKFHKVKGPGLFFLIPIADRVAQRVDIRIRVTDFSAQETLTLDSVTVTVDAVCFWHVWDPEKALLEVEDYEEAVVLSAKTALRSAVSRHDLSAFLAHGDLVEKQIREDVDRKTTDWGLTIHHIEITDVQVPEELQDALSRKAQAERERAGRVLLADAEIEIARKLEEAVAVYARDGTALRLKILSILNEGLKAGNSMMLIPNSIAEALQTGGVFGDGDQGGAGNKNS
ncbi:MAG: slipin family protein [Spirochaetaceae bacterium]|jgi:regulator of protease activity HflC (stomatin/prohibitin superfamily)|nr:slipin family protein [Spirochaetaceae bacterium]